MGAAVALVILRSVRGVDPVDPAETAYMIPCGRSRLRVCRVLCRWVVDGAAGTREVSVMRVH